MEHRSKHRLMRSVYFVVIFLFLVYVMTNLFSKYSSPMALLIGFIIGLGFFVAYEFLMLPKFRKHKELYVNSATQVYIGTISILSAVVTLLLHLFFDVQLEDGLFILAMATLVFLVFTIKPFDEFLEKRGH